MQIGSGHVVLCFSIRMRRRWVSDFGLYMEGWVIGGKGSTSGCHLVSSSYTEVDHFI